MENRVLLVCEEEGCSEKSIERVIELNGEKAVSDIYLLRVIKHPSTYM